MDPTILVYCHFRTNRKQIFLSDSKCWKLQQFQTENKNEITLQIFVNDRQVLSSFFLFFLFLQQNKESTRFPSQ